MAGLEQQPAQKVTLHKVAHFTLSGGHFYSGLISVFVCVAALAIMDRLDEVDHQTLSWWLSERQLPNGGLNGRPEKLADVGLHFISVNSGSTPPQVCYSFWVLSALSILNKMTWIDADKLTAFILSAQDPELGGIADRPGDMADVFHTQFGVAGGVRSSCSRCTHPILS